MPSCGGGHGAEIYTRFTPDLHLIYTGGGAVLLLRQQSQHLSAVVRREFSIVRVTSQHSQPTSQCGSQSQSGKVRANIFDRSVNTAGQPGHGGGAELRRRRGRTLTKRWSNAGQTPVERRRRWRHCRRENSAKPSSKVERTAGERRRWRRLGWDRLCHRCGPRSSPIYTELTPSRPCA